MYHTGFQVSPSFSVCSLLGFAFLRVHRRSSAVIDVLIKSNIICQVRYKGNRAGKHKIAVLQDRVRTTGTAAGVRRSVKDLSFVILSWNSERYLAGCFESIIRTCSGEGLSYEVIVIDNGSNDGSSGVVGEYQHRHPETFQLILLERNRGTTYSRNLGLKKARGAKICILDSDTELGEGNLSDLLQRLDSDERVGIIAPRLLLPDGAVQNSVKRFPTMLNKLLKIPRIIFGIKTKNADFYDDFPFADEREADSAISACWFFRRELLETVGLLDEKIFYAPEDVDYSLRVWQAGYSILFYPAYTVLHHTQQITHKKPLSKTSLSHFRGLLYYYWKHGGWLVRPRYTVVNRLKLKDSSTNVQ